MVLLTITSEKMQPSFPTLPHPLQAVGPPLFSGRPRDQFQVQWRDAAMEGLSPSSSQFTGAKAAAGFRGLIS